jgi:hypothetical protein
MAYIRCDVASSGPYEYPFTGQWFPRCDVNPTGSWVACDCDEGGGRVYVQTSAGERHDLGPRHPDNPICPRWLPGRSVFRVAWVDIVAQGRTIDVDGHGFRIPGSESTFDASLAGSQGIRDIDEAGTIHFKDATDALAIDGLTLLHWRERGDYIVGVLAHTWLGISVFEKSTRRWYRAFPYDVQLLPGIAENGTVAASGENGGFIPLATWLTSPFDPHVEPIEPPIEPPVELPPIEPPIEPPPIDPPIHPPPVEVAVIRAAVFVDNCWQQVYEVDHQDHNHEDHGPVVGARRVKDDQLLKVRHDGEVEFEAGETPGADERLLPVPGGYLADREDGTFFIERAGPWEQ